VIALRFRTLDDQQLRLVQVLPEDERDRSLADSSRDADGLVGGSQSELEMLEQAREFTHTHSARRRARSLCAEPSLTRSRALALKARIAVRKITLKGFAASSKRGIRRRA
jgi:hypothetical protein